MAIELGTAYVSVVGDTKRLAKDVKDALKGAGGKGLEAPIVPTVDKKAAEKAGKETGEAVSKATGEAVRKSDVGNAVASEIAKSAKGANAGKEAAKIIVDGIADGVKQEMPRGGIGGVIVDGIAEGVKQGIDGEGIGGSIVDTIGGGIKSGNLGGAIKDAVLPGIRSIGDELRSSAESWAGGIANSLRSGDIEGATKEIGDTVQNTTDLIADIGKTFGLQLDGVRNFGTDASTILSKFGTDVDGAINTASGIKDQFDTIGTLLETVLPGKAGTGAAKIASALGLIAVPAWLTYITTKSANEIANEIQGTDYSIRETLQQGATAPVRISGDIFGTPVPDWANPYVANRFPTIFGDQGPTGESQRQRRGLGPMDPTGGLLGGTIPGTAGRGYFNSTAASRYLDDQALLNNVPVGQYTQQGSADLTQGLADCSSSIEDLINIIDGQSTAGRSLTTMNASQLLPARGFMPGSMPGAFNIGFNADHMQATLPGGTPFNWGSNAAAARRGIGGTGAFDPAFTQHFYRYGSGGGVRGAGSGNSDSIPAMLSNGEHVLSSGDVQKMGGQGAVYNFRSALHRASGGSVSLEDMRTAGAMPAAAGNMGKAGDSTLAKGIDMGGEIINSIIDQAASAVSTAASAAAIAGSMGAAGPEGGQAAGAAAQFAIGLASNTAKRGVTYGFDLLGIGADSILQQLTPFGMPRWLSTDPGAFVPNGAITGALKGLMSNGANQAAGVDPNGTGYGTGLGAESGPVDPAAPGADPFAPGATPSAMGPAELVPPNLFQNSSAENFLSTQLAVPDAAPANQQPIFKVDNIYTTDAESVGRELNRRGRLAQMQYTNRPGP